MDFFVSALSENFRWAFLYLIYKKKFQVNFSYLFYRKILDEFLELFYRIKYYFVVVFMNDKKSTQIIITIELIEIVS